MKAVYNIMINFNILIKTSKYFMACRYVTRNFYKISIKKSVDKLHSPTNSNYRKLKINRNPSLRAAIFYDSLHEIHKGSSSGFG